MPDAAEPVREPYPSHFAAQYRARMEAEEQRILEMRRAEDAASNRARLSQLGQEGVRQLREQEQKEQHAT